MELPEQKTKARCGVPRCLDPSGRGMVGRGPRAGWMMHASININQLKVEGDIAAG